MNVPLMKQTSAFVPILFSLTALAILLGHVGIYGVTREADEGTPAHVFQLLMVAQVPVVAFFAIKWLPRAPRQAGLVLGLQAAAYLMPLAALKYFGM